MVTRSPHRYELKPSRGVIFFTILGWPVAFPADRETRFLENARVVVREGAFETVGVGSSLGIELVVNPERLRDCHGAGAAGILQTPEEITQFIPSEVFKDAAVGEEDGHGRGMLLEPVHDVGVVKMQSGIGPVNFATRGHLSGVQVDAVERADRRDGLTQVGKNEPVSSSHFDQPDLAGSQFISHCGDVSYDPGMVFEKQILEAIREAIIEKGSGGGGPKILVVALDGAMIASGHCFCKMGIADQASWETPISAEGPIKNIFRERGTKSGKDRAKEGLDAAVGWELR